MNNPSKIKIEDRVYEIDTDFRTAIRCNEIAQDTSIGDFERSLAIIYTLFGEKGLQASYDYERLLELGQRYLLMNKEPVQTNENEKDFDYIQDMDYIKASFMSDYNIDLDEKYMHWWTFNNLLNGLSNSELGNCCILNRIRNLRNMDVSKIKDKKERDKIIKAKKEVALKKEIHITKEQQESIDRLNKIMGFGKE